VDTETAWHFAEAISAGGPVGLFIAIWALRRLWAGIVAFGDRLAAFVERLEAFMARVESHLDSAEAGRSWSNGDEGQYPRHGKEGHSWRGDPSGAGGSERRCIRPSEAIRLATVPESPASSAHDRKAGAQGPTRSSNGEKAAFCGAPTFGPSQDVAPTLGG
jgi:hypothetical protein